MYGRRRPHRERVLSEMYPISGSVSASVRRGSAPSSPTNAGFIPSPRLRTIIIPPIAAAEQVVHERPGIPYATFFGKEMRSSGARQGEAQRVCAG
jgi:hypothetical protein